jgi:hypothetical protein
LVEHIREVLTRPSKAQTLQQPEKVPAGILVEVMVDGVRPVTGANKKGVVFAKN